MKFYVYLQVPEYVREWAINSFPFDGVGIRINQSFALCGFINSHLARRKNWFPKEETGNLAIEIHNLSDNKQKHYWNYMSIQARKRLGILLHQIMFSEYWFWMLPHWRALTAGKKSHDTTMQGFTLQWFAMKKITCDETAILRFYKDFYRERSRILESYNICFK